MFGLASEWVEKAETFLSEAKSLYKRGVYWLACFHAHQACELYLKAVLVEKTGVHPFTHDLAVLLDELADLGLKVPEEVYRAAEYLTPHYLTSRYPRKRAIRYSERKASYCLEAAETIVKWVRGVLGTVKRD